MNANQSWRTLIIAAVLILTACSAAQSQPAFTPGGTETPEPAGTTQANMANPAAVYCQQRGYQVEIRTAEDGSQSGVCIFPDGSECDEWAYFRGECYPGAAQTTSEAAATPIPLAPTPGSDLASDGCKVFRNPELGYSFHYPVGATIQDNDNPLHGFSVIGPVNDGETWPIFSIAHPRDRPEYRPPENVDLQQWLTDNYLLGATRMPDMTIAGVTAIHLRQDRSPQTYAFDRYYFARSGQLYMVIIGHTGDQEDWELYNHFLGSFQFEEAAIGGHSGATVVAIQNVTVVDIEKGTSVPGQTVIIDGDRIDQVGPQGKVRIPKEAETTIDGSGLYLMPGLVDAHVHYFDNPIFSRLLVANGVLLVRDMGMPNEYILSLRDELNQGETLGPEMSAAGAILDGKPPLIPLISLGVTTQEEGRDAVRQQAEAGADFIKTYSRLEREVFLTILEEAQKSGLKVSAHLPETIYIEDAAAAGLGSSEHFNGFEKVIAKLLGEPVRLAFKGQASQSDYFQRLDEVNRQELQAVYRRIRSSGLTICPTVVTFKTLTNIQPYLAGSFPRREFISQSVLDNWRQQWPQQADLPDFIWRSWVQMVRDLNDAGVPLMVGTDLTLPGILPGYSVHEEMVIWQEAGIPPVEILRSATIVPVEWMDKDDRLGSVQVGKTASIVLVGANPLEDIRNAQQIEGVFLRGRYFSRADLDKLLLEAKRLARQGVAP